MDKHKRYKLECVTNNPTQQAARALGQPNGPQRIADCFSLDLTKQTLANALQEIASCAVMELVHQQGSKESRLQGPP